MNSIVKKYCSNSSISENSRSSLDPERTYTFNKSFDLVVGIATAAIAFPIVALTILVGNFCSQEKWEEFWDNF